MAARLSLEASVPVYNSAESIEPQIPMETLEAANIQSSEVAETKSTSEKLATLENSIEIISLNSKESEKKLKKSRKCAKKEVMQLVSLNCDIIRDAFWKERPHLLGE